ncbi:MAG: hypothetical protein ABIH42_01335, partial [Planctomycetota bacterium]
MKLVYKLFQRIKPYLSFCRNLVVALLKYRSISAAMNAVKGLFFLFVSDIANILYQRQLVKCNVCGWTGTIFYPTRGIGVSQKGIICPRCESYPRQR